MPSDVAQAKAWYEVSYPSSVSTSGSLVTQSTGGSRDLSKLIKPDWQHAASYVSNNKNVIEIPVDLGSRFSLTVKIGSKALNRAYSRSSYLLISDSKSYQAYILTIIADSAYVGNDLSKLSHNTYRKQDADFSGLALYYSPKGDYLGGYAYKNGQVVVPATATQQTGNQKIQSVNTGTLKPTDIVETCVDWYDQTTVTYTDGTSITGPWVYSGTRCTTITTTSSGGGGGGSGTGPSGGGGGGGSGGNGSSSSPLPPPCPAGSTSGVPTTSPCVPPSPPAVESIGKLKVDYMPLPGQSTCSVTTAPVPCYTIKNNVTNTCLHNMVDATINANISTVINSLIQKVFNGSSYVNATYIDGTDLQPGQEGFTPPPSSLDANGNLTITIKLNRNELPHYSQQFIATVIMHESLHAYLTTINNLGALQHETIATTFVTQMALDLQQMFPGLSDADAKNLALGGLEATDTFKNTIAKDMKLLGSYQATQLAYSTGSLGLRCN